MGGLFNLWVAYLISDLWVAYLISAYLISLGGLFNLWVAYLILAYLISAQEASWPNIDLAIEKLMCFCIVHKLCLPILLKSLCRFYC